MLEAGPLRALGPFGLGEILFEQGVSPNKQFVEILSVNER